MYVSGVGVVPKKSGKLRLIHHLSSPSGRSVNDGIPKADFSLHYVTIDNAISAILAAPIESRHQVGIPHLPGPSRRLAPPWHPLAKEILL